MFETHENQQVARHWPRVVMNWPRLAATSSDWPPSDPASSATKNYLRGPPIRRIIAARVATRTAVALSAGLTIAGKGSVRVGNQSRHFLCSCCSCSCITNKSTPIMLRWIGIPSKENCSVGSASVRVINEMTEISRNYIPTHTGWTSPRPRAIKKVSTQRTHKQEDLRIV